MKKAILLTSILIFIGSIAGASKSPTKTIPLPTLQTGKCDSQVLSDEWSHVYHPNRLQKQSLGCITITGTVMHRRPEKDGDYHLTVSLDTASQQVLDDVANTNVNQELVVEPICQRRVTQRDAIAACQNFNYSFDIPVVGDQIEASGDYVFDSQHGWFEIHPVTDLTIQ